jgi:serine/threonine protein kinase
MTDESASLRIDGISAERLVRRGDHTELYQAVQVPFGRRVAVKLYTADGARSTALARFERECALMGDLSSHPNVVTYFDSGVKRRRPFVVSEWLEDGSFADLLQKGQTVAWDDAVRVGVKVAGALESAHRAGLIHRKLKPEDVFLSAFGEPLVGDFHVDPAEGSRSGDQYDIMVHAAPELFRGAQGDARVDVYALASVLFTLILGRPPFVEAVDEPLVRIKGRALTAAPPDLRTVGVPAPVFAALAWGLRPEPEQRPATAQEYGRALQAGLVASGRGDTRLLVRPLTAQDRSLDAPTVPAAALALINGPSVAAVPKPPAAAVAAPPATPAPPAPAGPPLPPPAVAAPSGDAAAFAPPRLPAPPPSAAPAGAAPPAATTQPPADTGQRAQVLSPEVLVQRVRQLIDSARSCYTDPLELTRMDRLEQRLDEPLRVAIAGKVKAGKSTLLNGLVGEELAPTNASECTKIVTWYVDGLTYSAALHHTDGRTIPTALNREGGAIEVDLQGHEPDQLDRVVVQWPSSSLGDLSLIDTPGVESLSTEVSARTTRFALSSPEQESQADAVLYLMRHLHPTDVRFLEAFQDQQVGRTNPINAIGVLSRADELAGGQQDAMEAASRVAERYRNTAQVRSLCQTVVPVAGLLGQAAAVLVQGDYNLLARLAALPSETRDVLFASADRFVDADLVGDVLAADRERLFRMLGMYGVRLAIGAIADGTVDNSHALAMLLFERSGLAELRRVLMSQFAARRDVLKSQATLTALAQRVRQQPPPTGAERLEFEIERLRTEAHVFAELELFAAVRAGSLDLRPEDEAEVERLLGAQGYAPTTRLGLPPDATPEVICAELSRSIDKWRGRAENPLNDPNVTVAAEALVRSCEGMLAAIRIAA